MKLRRIVAATMFVIAFCAQAKSPQVLVKSDRFHPGDVTVESDPHSIDVLARGGPQILWTATVSGGKPSQLGMVILFNSREWRYLQCSDTVWMIDGQSASLAPFHHDGTPLLSGVQERLTGAITADQLANLLRAKTIEFRVCKDEYKFTPDQTAHMMDFGAQLAHQLQQK